MRLLLFNLASRWKRVDGHPADGRATQSDLRREAAMKRELERRQSLKDKLRALFLARPDEWISIAELAPIGGVGGWRTRLSELSREGMTIQWNGQNGILSAHCYRPQSLGRDAAVQTPVRWDGKQRYLF